MLAYLQAGFGCNYIIAEGFHPQGEDGCHDNWRVALRKVVERRQDTIVYIADASMGDMMVLEEVLAGKAGSKLIDAWTDMDIRAKCRQVRGQSNCLYRLSMVDYL